MAEGTILYELHNPIIGIDDHGNIVLNAGAAPAGTPSRGRGGVVGKGIPYKVAISNAAGGTQYYSLVTFQVNDVLGNAIAQVMDLDIYLSDAATGIGLTGTSASGGVTVPTSGAVLGILTAAKAFRVQTDATGKAIMQIIDSAKTGFYPVAALSDMGVTVGAQLTSGSYHA